MPLTRRNLLLGGLGALAAACVPGGGGATPVRIAAGGSNAQGKLRIGGLTGLVGDQGWLAERLAEQGRRLELVNMPHAIGGPMINEGFVRGTIDFAYYGDLPAVIGSSAGAPVQLVLPFNGGGNTYVLVPVTSAVKSVADLRGRRVALHRGRPWESVFARYAAASGLRLADFEIVNVNPSAGAAALAAGKVEAFVGPIADAYRLQEQDLARVLWSTKEAPPSWLQRVELFGRAPLIEAEPEIAALVAQAYVRAAHWASLPENRDAYITRLSRETPERAIRADLDGSGPWKERFSPLPSDDQAEHYGFVADHALRTGLIERAPDLAALTHTDFAIPAIEAAGLTDYWSGARRSREAANHGG